MAKPMNPQSKLFPELTARQSEVLDILRSFIEARPHSIAYYGGARPSDLGGYRGSDHSTVLKQLVKKGFVIRKLRRKGLSVYITAEYLQAIGE